MTVYILSITLNTHTEERTQIEHKLQKAEEIVNQIATAAMSKIYTVDTDTNRPLCHILKKNNNKKSTYI